MIKFLSLFSRGLAATLDKSLGVNDFFRPRPEMWRNEYQSYGTLGRRKHRSLRSSIPTKVPLGHKKGKAILVSGHDLKDLEKVLKQSEGKGVYVYTHGEMLPAHGYPNLKKYPHFFGHYGTAWQNQQKEFMNFPGAILMTTNCIQKPSNKYQRKHFHFWSCELARCNSYRN